MGFGADLRVITKKIEAKTHTVFVNVVAAVHESITVGSPVTGAPGQPVDTGALRASWITALETPTSALISTNLAYAPSIEDGISYAHGGTPLTLRSDVGGFHSVKLTADHLDQLVASEVAKVAD